MEFIENIGEKSIHDVAMEIDYKLIKFTKEGEFSMVRRLNKDTIYPRFHLYGKRLNGHTIFKLHLDRVKPWNTTDLDHNREYHGKEVVVEVERIKSII